MSAGADYDTIGQGYARQHRPDPRIAACLTAADALDLGYRLVVAHLRTAG